jgi:Fic family protein
VIRIVNSLEKIINQHRSYLSDIERLIYFKEQYAEVEFTRNDYLAVFKDISTATANRDMKKGIEKGFWVKVG